MQLSRAAKSPQVPRNVSEGQLEMVFGFDNVNQIRS